MAEERHGVIEQGWEGGDRKGGKKKEGKEGKRRERGRMNGMI